MLQLNLGLNLHMFEGCDVLAELTQHIPPKGIQNIRRYGLYASRTKGKWPEHPEIARHAPEGLVADFVCCSPRLPGWKASQDKLTINEEIIELLAEYSGFLKGLKRMNYEKRGFNRSRTCCH